MRLTPEEVGRIEAAVLGPRGRELMALMRLLTTFQPAVHISTETKAEARALGWTDATDYPTKLGWLVGNPLRELLLWEERGGELPYRAMFPILADETFRGRRVLEIGCGTGCNLLSLQPLAGQLMGVELEPFFLQMTPLVCKLAGRPVPERLQGQAEALPVGDGAFDVVMIIASLQYMTIERVLAEVRRVLAPGGLGIFTLSDLRGAARELIRVLPGLRPRALAKELVLMAGNVTYPVLGRAYQPAGTPVYPMQRVMRRWIERAGLSIDPRTRQSGHEVCWVVTL